ncbi:MAG TPA: hypothetical protein VHU92_12890 [Streptosporangiaceae bacterium]|jgi:hypothetical protein|nr:hypothetical protein [Streptosporangiaceae bacterium]
MHSIHEQARQRQYALLSAAAARQRGGQVWKMSRAARRAQRAERQLSRSWHVAVQRRAELSELADSWQ